MYTVSATRPVTTHGFASTAELMSFVNAIDPLAYVDVEPHDHHFHVTVQYSPSVVNVRTEAHAHALAEIFRKAGYHNVTVEQTSAPEDATGLIDSIIDALLNGEKK